MKESKEVKTILVMDGIVKVSGEDAPVKPIVGEGRLSTYEQALDKFKREAIEVGNVDELINICKSKNDQIISVEGNGLVYTVEQQRLHKLAEINNWRKCDHVDVADHGSYLYRKVAIVSKAIKEATRVFGGWISCENDKEERCKVDGGKRCEICNPCECSKESATKKEQPDFEAMAIAYANRNYATIPKGNEENYRYARAVSTYTFKNACEHIWKGYHEPILEENEWLRSERGRQEGKIASLEEELRKSYEVNTGLLDRINELEK